MSIKPDDKRSASTFVKTTIKPGPYGVHTCDLWAEYQRQHGRMVYGRTNFTRALQDAMAEHGYPEDRALRLGRTTKRGYKGVKICNT